MPTPGNIAVPNEVDNYAVQLKADTPYVAEVHGATTGAKDGFTLRDPFVLVGDLATGGILAVQDNTPKGGLDPILNFEVPVTGNYIVSVGSVVGDTGTYDMGIFDQKGNLQPGVFFTDIEVSPILPQVGITGVPQNDADAMG